MAGESGVEGILTPLAMAGGFFGYLFSWAATNDIHARMNSDYSGAITGATLTTVFVAGCVGAKIWLRNNRIETEKADYERLSEKHGCEPMPFMEKGKMASMHAERGNQYQMQGRLENALANYSMAAELDASIPNYVWQRDTAANTLAYQQSSRRSASLQPQVQQPPAQVPPTQQPQVRQPEALKNQYTEKEEVIRL